MTSSVHYSSLRGKSVFITGASGGIGQSLGKLFFQQGCHVVLSGRSEASLLSLQEEILKNPHHEDSHPGGQCHIFPMDLSDGASMEKTLKDSSSLSPIDIFISNGGITMDKLSLRLTDDDMSKVLQVNLQAAFTLSRYFLRSMMAKKWGRIVYISSVIGFTGNKGQANYAASKGGLVSMCKSLALEYAPKGITCNTIAPGYIDTPMTQNIPNDIKKIILDKIPMGYYGCPQDVAQGALFLASEESRYITGQTLHINGGMAMI